MARIIRSGSNHWIRLGLISLTCTDSASARTTAAKLFGVFFFLHAQARNQYINEFVVVGPDVLKDYWDSCFQLTADWRGQHIR
ncbi:hypothetical protein CFIMG_003392RAa [Ceratocystis fimbriata CBS 114723]|uniref:Uncharacterized protein n=1 Tax=Ceratocystis fimbriata CBS 114723 TaxID=1035309 RepID=A0A2C5XAP5_9PEZI|nr:hypothetical protein CFIMG_003392RAa [Ceratocystis fimbriata CBS 114723]